VKFRCERDVLVEALATAQRATSSRATLPVLSGLRLALSGDELRLTGSDLDLTITTEVRVSGDDDGVAVLPAKFVVDIVRSLEGGAVEIDTDGDAARISAGRSNFRLHTIPADEFPNLVEPTGEKVVLTAADLAEGLRQVVKAASRDESRPILTGVLLAAEGQGLRMVSTDSYRLAVRDLPGNTALREGQTVLVPSKALDELSRVLVDDTEVTLVLGERDASFQVGTFRLTTRLIEGEFPNYRGLIPTSQSNHLVIARAALLEAVRRVRLMARENSPVRLTMSSGQLELRAVTLDVGEASEVLDANYDGEELTVAFNPEYLVDGLEVTPGDEISLETLDSLKPALLRPVDDSDFLYLLMPVRVS
jgi:DNA polymerase III subunit beta